MKKIRVGLYGMNGHQIHNRLKNHPDGEIGAVCFPDKGEMPGFENVPHYDTLEAMLTDDTLDMICLCHHTHASSPQVPE